MTRATPLQRAAFILVAALLALFLLYPIALSLRAAFAADVSTTTGWTFRHVALVFRDPVLREGLWNAAFIAAATTALCLVLSAPLALLSTRRSFPFRDGWNALILLPLILPPFVGAIGLKAVLGRAGALNALLGTEWDLLGEHRRWGVIIALALHLYPVTYLNLAASLANLNPAMDEAARVFGASPWRRLRAITLPLVRPGVFAGAAIVFVWAFTELGTPLVFDYYAVTSVQIYNGVKRMDASAEPYALTAVMLGLTVVMYLALKTFLGRPGHAGGGRAATASGDARLSPMKGALASGAFALVTLLAVIPHIGVVGMALAAPGSWRDSVAPQVLTLGNFENALSHPLAFGAIRNSIVLAAAAAAIDVVLGLLIAALVTRTKLRGRWALDALAMLPLAVPGLVMAFGYIALSLRWPFGKGDPLEGVLDVVSASPNPFPLLIIAYAVRRLPYVVRAAAAGLEQVSHDIEEAARVFGASAFRAMRVVVVPLVAANLIAGGLLAFSFAALEVSDSMILAQQERHYPLTKALYAFSERLGDGQGVASALGVWGMALLAVTLIGASALLGKSMGKVFRA